MDEFFDLRIQQRIVTDYNMRRRVRDLAADREKDRERKRRERQELARGKAAYMHVAESAEEWRSRDREAARQRRERPDDLRSLTGILLGDPPTGRSALDKRNGS